MRHIYTTPMVLWFVDVLLIISSRYTLPRALQRVDEHTARALHAAALALSGAAAAGVVEIKWGGVFGQELSSVVRTLKVNRDATTLEAISLKGDAPPALSGKLVSVAGGSTSANEAEKSVGNASVVTAPYYALVESSGISGLSALSGLHLRCLF